MKRWLTYLVYSLILVGIYIWIHISPAIFEKSGIQIDKKVTITGHRGAASYAPENTLAAIKKGMEANVDRIEIDIHQSKDSVVIVMHDNSVDRTTNGSGDISDFLLADLKKLDAGSFFNSDYKGEKIPTLEEVFKIVNGKCDLLIEFKHGNEDYPGIEERVIGLIKKYNAMDWCIVHSFNTDVLVRMHEKMPELRLHKLLVIQFLFTPYYYDDGLHAYNPKDYPFIEEYSVYYPFANRRFLNRLKKMGKKVNVWTVDNSKRINSFIDLGVDGIITDSP